MNTNKVIIVLFPGSPTLRCKIQLKNFIERLGEKHQSKAFYGCFFEDEPKLNTILHEVSQQLAEVPNSECNLWPLFFMPGQMQEHDLPKILIDQQKKYSRINFKLLKSPDLMDELFDSFHESLITKIV